MRAVRERALLDLPAVHNDGSCPCAVEGVYSAAVLEEGTGVRAVVVTPAGVLELLDDPLLVTVHLTDDTRHTIR